MKVVLHNNRLIFPEGSFKAGRIKPPQAVKERRAIGGTVTYTISLAASTTVGDNPIGTGLFIDYIDAQNKRVFQHFSQEEVVAWDVRIAVSRYNNNKRLRLRVVVPLALEAEGKDQKKKVFHWIIAVTLEGDALENYPLLNKHCKTIFGGNKQDLVEVLLLDPPNSPR